MELQVQQDQLERLARVEEVIPVHQVLPDHLVPLALQVILDLPVVLVHPEELDQQDHSVQQVGPDSREPPDPRDKLVLQEIRDPREFQVPPGARAIVILLEEQDKLVLQVLQVHQVQLEQQGRLERVDLLGVRVVSVPLETLGFREPQLILVLQVLWVLVESLVPLDLTDPLEIQEIWELQVLLEQVGTRDHRDLQAPVREDRDLKEQLVLQVRVAQLAFQECPGQRDL